MALHLQLWLWLAVQAAILPHQPQPGEASYILVRWPQDFPGAQAWCWLHGGSLLRSWGPHAKGFLQHNLDSGSRSWIAPHTDVPQAQAEARGWAGRRPECQSITRTGDQFWARKEACSEKLPFVCQSGPQRLRREASSPQQLRHHCAVRCSPGPRATTTSGPALEPVTAPQSFQPGTPTHKQADGPPDASCTPGASIHPMTGVQHTSSPQAQPGHPLYSMEQHQSSTPAEARVHLQPCTWPQGSPQPLQTASDKSSTPEAAASPGPGPQPTSETIASEGPESSPSHSSVGSTTLGPWDVPSEDTGQALEQLLCQFHQMVPTLGHTQAVERASQALQDLTSSPALLSEDAQAQASHALQFLSSQLPTEVLASNSSSPGSAAAALSLLQALSSLLMAVSTNASASWGSRQQQQAALSEILAALPLIQTGLLMGSTSAEATVTAEAPALSTTLSSCSASALPHSSFHLSQPKALSVTFPSASTLAPLLSQHSQAPVQVQVASFALDPFQPLGGRAMASVASIALRTSEGPVTIHSLQEAIEVAFGAEDVVEGSVTQLNGGSRRFSMEVNITSLEDALLVSMRPSTPLHITLRMAPPPQTQANCCLLSTTLPKGRWHQEGAYVWVVAPESLQQHGLGTYSLSAQVALQPQRPSNISITIASVGCYHWAGREQAWRSTGCRVGPQSTLRRTQCLCSHLSFFGHFLVVVPHVLDLRQVGQLLGQVGQNPAGLALVGSLSLAYGALLLWAHRRQRADTKKVKVTPLAGHAGSASCQYLVQVFTGYRRGAATSAQVVLTLYGTEGRSEPHLLRHPEAPSFETGSMDAFLLTTRQPLGTLHAIRLWHDNSGSSPNWFVRRLVVSDLATREKRHFLCDCWLAVDMEDGEVDKVFMAASDKELRSFRHLFWAGLVEKLTQEHLWLSVVTCSAWSPFTRVQRLSCCLALLLCSMLINIMFWRGPEEEEEEEQLAGALLVTWQELVVSVQAAILLTPLHLLVVHIFRLVQPPALQPASPPRDPQSLQLATVPLKQRPSITRIRQELTETVGFLYKHPLCCCQDMAEFPGTWKQLPELVDGLCALICSCLQQLEKPEALTQERSSTLCYLCHVVHALEAQLRSLDWHRLQNPYALLHALDHLHQLQKQLQQQQQRHPRPSHLSSFPMEEALAEPGRPYCSSGFLPGRFQFLCWLVVGTVGLVSGFFTVLYSLKLSRAQATHWVTSMALSVLQGVLLIQPLKLLSLTLIFSVMRKRQLCQDKGQEQVLQRALLLAEGHLPPRSPDSRDRATSDATICRPPPLQPAAWAKERPLKEKKLYFLAREIVVQLTFLAVLMVLCYAERSPSQFYLNNALQKGFARQMSKIQTLEHLYGWAKRALLPSIYPDSEGFTMDADSFLVGSVRLRQVRAEEGPEKPGPAFFWPQRDLYAASQGHRGCPSPHWGPSDRAQEDAWVYQSESTLQEYPTRGKFAVYPGGGYLADLGRNASHANRILHALAQEKWLDRCTRAILVEFTVYNANVNLFCAVTLMLERNGLGKRGLRVGKRCRPRAITSSTALQTFQLHPNSQMLVPLACAQLTFLLLLLYYIVMQGRSLKQQQWRHFRTQRNLLDAFSTLISLAVVGLYVRRGLLAASVLRQHRQDRSRFLRVSEVANTDAALTYLIAFLVALTTVKLWTLLRLNPRMHLITRTLQKAWDEILQFLLTLLVLLIAYASACNLLFGWSIVNFKTFFDSAVTMVGLLAGIFNYEVVIALDPVLGSLLLASSILSMVFVIISLFVSALLTIFSREMAAAKVSKEESLMQLIQLKISSLLGIKQGAPANAPSGTAKH